MATEVVNDVAYYQISVRGPNGEEEKVNVTAEDSAAILKQRIMMSPRFTVYTNFHFELENTKGGEDLYLDAYTPFGQIPLMGQGATALLVPDLYDANTISYQIKHSIALLTNKIPLISQLVKLNNEEVPESIKEYSQQLEVRKKQLEEKKEVTPFDLKTRVLVNGKAYDAAYRDIAALCVEEPKGNDLSSFMKLYNSVNEELTVSIRSLSVSSYNPPTANRKAMGDLIYLRVHTSENNIFHITGNADGFFVNKSTDSVFDPSTSTDYPNVYPTLPAILGYISSGFKQWYLRSRNLALSSNMSLIVRSLPILPSLTSSSEGWFNTMTEKDSSNLFDYADQMMSDSLPIPMLNTVEPHHWMIDYNTIKESNLTEDMKNSLILAKEQGFAAAATRACKSIVDDGVPSLFTTEEVEACYVVDDIFITTASAESNILTCSDCDKEVVSTRILNGLDVEGLHTGLIVVVDYKGHRFLAQAAIPGIISMSANAMMLYGSVDEGHTIYTDPRIQPIMQKMAEKMNWAVSHVHPQPASGLFPEQDVTPAIPEAPASTASHCDEKEAVEFFGPVEGRMVRGSDNRLYAADFVNITPVDAAWVEDHAKLFPNEPISRKNVPTVRRSLVMQWLVSRIMLQNQKDELSDLLARLEKGEKVEGVELTAEQIADSKKRVEEIQKELDTTATKFDINAFTCFSDKGVAGEEDVRALGVMLRESLLPRVFKGLVENKENYDDTEGIVRDLHGASINARYLGELAKLCSDDQEAVREIIEEEIVARCAKHVLRELMNNEVLMSAAAFVTTTFLNAVICQERKKDILLSGKNRKSKKVPSVIAQTIIRQNLSVENVWGLIEADAKKHFHYDLKLWFHQKMDQEKRYRLMRRVCQQCGIQLDAIEYNLVDDYAVKVENVIAFLPRVKYASTTAVDDTCAEYTQSLLTLLEQGKFAEVYDMAKRILLQLISAHSQLHPQLVNLLDVMTAVLTSTGDYGSAIETARAALYTANVVYGKDSLDSAKYHTQLATILFKNECFYEALVHNQIALYIYTAINGHDSQRVKLLYMNLGMCLMQCGFPKEALKYMEMVMEASQKDSDEFLNAAFYACILNASFKNMDASKECKTKLEEALASKDEAFKKTMLENLQKQLKELH